MEQLIRIGLDTSKRFFQLHGVDAAERPVLRRQLRRSEVIGFFRPACADFGAKATIWQTRRGAARQASSRQASPWLLALLQRKPAKLAAVALANKIARIAWKLMTSAERYAGAPQPAAIA